MTHNQIIPGITNDALAAAKLTAHQIKVYQLLSKVPKGKITTYGDIARALGNNGSRAVGNSLNKNPFAPTIPCHRVVLSDGRVGGYAGGLEMKLKLLSEEGIVVENGKVKDFEAQKVSLHR